QAEDGIRDWSVTGVQTCALPISQLFYLVGINCTIAIEYIANPHECLTLSIRVQVVTLHSYPRTYLASNLGACTFYQTSSPHLSPPRAIPETGCNRTHTRNTRSTHRQHTNNTQTIVVA